MPLQAERAIPFRCAVSGPVYRRVLAMDFGQLTVPDPRVFARGKPLPFFVVFTTAPGAPSDLADEMAADATTVVSLVRQVYGAGRSVAPRACAPTSTRVNLPTPPPTPPVPGGPERWPPVHAYPDDHSSGRRTTSPVHERRRLMKRTTRAQMSQHSVETEDTQSRTSGQRHKRVAGSGAGQFWETRTVERDVSIGFPHRPQQQRRGLPDGLYRGELRLGEAMLPSVDWQGVGVQVGGSVGRVCSANMVDDSIS